MNLFSISLALAMILQAPPSQVNLVLLQPVKSGMAVGSKVAFVVAQDVKSPDGKLLIKAGTPAYGEIVDSRKAGTLSKLENTPARLAIKLDNTYTTARKPIALESSSGDPILDLNRTNTAEMPKDPKLEAAWKDPQERQMLKDLVAQFQDQSPQALSAQEQQLLQQQAPNLSLTNTEQLCQQGKLSELPRFMGIARNGQDFLIPAGLEGQCLCGCVLEIANLCQKSRGYLGGRFEGANIVALPGTEIQVRVAT